MRESARVCASLLESLQVCTSLRKWISLKLNWIFLLKWIPELLLDICFMTFSLFITQMDSRIFA